MRHNVKFGEYFTNHKIFVAIVRWLGGDVFGEINLARLGTWQIG